MTGLLSDMVFSCRLHIQLFIGSFLQGRQGPAAINGSRLRFLLLVFPFYGLVLLLQWVAWSVDELLFSGYHNIPVKNPLFVSGVPRSGTTFVHRSLSQDKQYATFTTWETLLAPSITGRKLVRILSGVDHRMGRPLRRTLDRVLATISSGFNDIHEIHLSDAEEDYLALLPFGGCFILFTAFPFSEYLLNTARLDKMSGKQRHRLLNIYHRVLQKHLFCSPNNRRLLSKNAVFASWMPFLAEQYPDANFILCVREPLGALSSQLSSIRNARMLFGTDPEGIAFAGIFRKLFAHHYRSLLQFVESQGKDRVVIIDQAEMKHHSQSVLRQTIDILHLALPPEMDTYLRNLPEKANSTHHYDQKELHGSDTQIVADITPLYQQLLTSDAALSKRNQVM